MKQRTKKRLVRMGVVMANVSLLGLVSLFVINTDSSTTVSNKSLSALQAGVVSKPLDSLSSTDVAVHVARITGMPEATAVVNKADTISAQLAVASTDDQATAKPQIIGAGLKSKKDIKTYVVAPGDTTSALAARFSISPDTIKVSNDVAGEELPVGRKLLISPVNGMIYVVKPGDTPDSIASKYAANRELLIAFNDAELTGRFVPGERIVIPDAQQPRPAARFSNYSSSYGGYAFGTSAIYGGNGYVRGFCTWGVANLIPVPTNWGNASSWAAAARLSGWTVSDIPRVGAIAQTGGGYGGLGHVGIVTAVSPDGTMIKYKDMNGLAGFGRYGETPDFIPAKARFQKFIYR